MVTFAAMLTVKSFTFNPFQENTYVVYNEQKQCIIFDPGMYDAGEQDELDSLIRANGLVPMHLVNTHCHIDHIMGNTYCAEKYKLPLQAHELERGVLGMGKTSAVLYGLRYTESVDISVFISEKDTLSLGDESFTLLFTPGHSPGSLSFYSKEHQFVIAGDALFRESIGRTDLPGGHHETLINAIKQQLLTLPDDTIVYSGHGPSTTIGHERVHNPYLS